MPLLSATRKSVSLSPPLPVPNATFATHGLLLRRGQFSILAAGPGVGKSVFATNLSLATKVPTVFFSADSDEWTVRGRACSILSGTRLDEVERHLNDEAQQDIYADLLRSVDHIDWCYQTDIDLEFLVLRLQAHAELRGEYPQLIVVDNLGNTVSEQENEYAELRGICRELQRIARTTGAHVLALHHVKGAKEGGYIPIGVGDLLGNIGKVCEVVLGLNRTELDGEVNLTVPKNRGGKSQLSIPLSLDYSRATVSGFAA